MYLEIAKDAKMSMDSRAILASLQNQSMSNVDLFVREALQNSLDAALNNGNYDKVIVNFKINTFDIDKLNDQMAELGKELSRYKKSLSNEFIMVEDHNTCGLDGDLLSKPSGNFRKLVYEIAKPQLNKDAGGSWGYGKTIFFRMGIGLVFYYTRFKDCRGNYIERLAATYVENNTSGLCDVLDKISIENRGIAWLGKQIDNDITEPITDYNEISTILNVFGLSNYENNDTGTRIIIPFIDKDKLLSDYINKRMQKNNCYFERNIEDALTNSILCWYGPRINNPTYYKYLNKPLLRIKVNDNLVKHNCFFYEIIYNLYNYALCNNNNSSYEIKNKEEYTDIHIETINYYKLNDIAGTLVFGKFNKSLFMDEYLPYDYLGLENRAENGNRPIICFCRKPGMIVKYHEEGDWASRIPDTDDDTILIGIFVLNSNAILDGKVSLEEAMRKTEKADHTFWEEPHIENIKSDKMYSTIIRKVQSIIQKTYTKDININYRRQVKVSEKLGKLFLPSNYGNHATQRRFTKDNPKNPTISKEKGTVFRIDRMYDYTVNSMKLDISIMIGNNNVEIYPLVSTESGSKTRKQWEKDDGFLFPFKFKSFTLKELYFEKNHNNLISSSTIVYDNFSIEDLNIEINNFDETGDMHNLVFKRSNNKKYRIYGVIEVETSDREYLLDIQINKSIDKKELSSFE